MAAYWPLAKGEVADIMNAIPKIVFSTTLERAEWNNTRLVRESAEREVPRLKQQAGKDLFIFGSAHSFSGCVCFTHVCAVLRMSVVLMTRKMIDLRLEIGPNNRTRATSRFCLRFGFVLVSSSR